MIAQNVEEIYSNCSAKVRALVQFCLIYYPKAEGFDSPGSCLDGIDNDFDGKIDSFDKGCKR